MRRRASTPVTNTIEVGQMPRDVEAVEAVEAVIARLDRGVVDEPQVHGLIIETLVRELDIAYGAAWVAGEGGVFRLIPGSSPCTSTTTPVTCPSSAPARASGTR